MTISIKPEKIREARGERSQDHLAFQMSIASGDRITGQTISNWERGVSVPAQSNFSVLCQVTGKDPNFFYGIEVGGSPTDSESEKRDGEAA